MDGERAGLRRHGDVSDAAYLRSGGSGCCCDIALIDSGHLSPFLCCKMQLRASIVCFQVGIGSIRMKVRSGSQSAQDWPTLQQAPTLHSYTEVEESTTVNMDTTAIPKRKEEKSLSDLS